MRKHIPGIIRLMIFPLFIILYLKRDFMASLLLNDVNKYSIANFINSFFTKTRDFITQYILFFLVIFIILFTVIAIIGFIKKTKLHIPLSHFLIFIYYIKGKLYSSSSKKIIEEKNALLNEPKILFRIANAFLLALYILFMIPLCITTGIVVSVFFGYLFITLIEIIHFIPKERKTAAEILLVSFIFLNAILYEILIFLQKIELKKKGE